MGSQATACSCGGDEHVTEVESPDCVRESISFTRSVSSSVALVDDAEILFIGRRAAQDEVVMAKPSDYSYLPAFQLHLHRRLPTGVAGNEEHRRDPSIQGTEVPMAHDALSPRQHAKEAIAQLVRSLVKGRDVELWGEAVSTGATACTAFLDKSLTVLSLRRRASVLVLRRIPLEFVVQVVTEAEADSCGQSFVRLRLNLSKNGNHDRKTLFIAIGTASECDTFVACIRACAKHQRAALNAGTPEQTSDEVSGQSSGLTVSSTVLRAVSGVAALLRDGAPGAGANRRVDGNLVPPAPLPRSPMQQGGGAKSINPA